MTWQRREAVSGRDPHEPPSVEPLVGMPAPELSPPLWVLLLVAAAAAIIVVALRRHRGRESLLAGAGLLVGLTLAEVGAWTWFVWNPVDPPLSGRSEAPPPQGILVPSGVLPAAGRRPGERGEKPRVLFLGDSFTE